MTESVWIVLRGEKDEGGEVVAVMAKRPTDEEVLLMVHNHFEAWRIYEQTPSRTTWKNGCDLVSREEWAVK